MYVMYRTDEIADKFAVQMFLRLPPLHATHVFLLPLILALRKATHTHTHTRASRTLHESVSQKVRWKLSHPAICTSASESVV